MSLVVCVFVSPVLIPPSTKRRCIQLHHLHYTRIAFAFARLNFFSLPLRKNNNAAKFIVSLKQNISESFFGVP